MTNSTKHEKLYLYTFGVPNMPPEQVTFRASSESEALSEAKQLAQDNGWFPEPQLWAVLPVLESVILVGSDGSATPIYRGLPPISAQPGIVCA